MKLTSFKGFQRPDGSVGIRNKILVVAVDECCEGIARAVARPFPDAVILTNAYTCMMGGNEETFHQLVAVGQNPNVAGVLVLAMGCGSIAPEWVADPIRATGRPVYTVVSQQCGGTRAAVRAGLAHMQALQAAADAAPRVDASLAGLRVGIKCGGSDTSSGLASNPAVGAAADLLVENGATCVGGELFELIGCEELLRERAVNARVGDKIVDMILCEKRRWGVPGVEVETMSVGNSVGGLTTIEEKSLGALHKMGSKPIQDVLRISHEGVEKPSAPGFYLSDATMLCGAAGVNFAALGCQMVMWTTGGAGFNSALIPVVRVSGNSLLFNEDMDVDVSGIMTGTMSVEQAGNSVVNAVLATAGGRPTAVEDIADATMTLYQKDRRLESLLDRYSPLTRCNTAATS